MPATYEPIASTTLGSAASSVTFSSIPGTFSDLVLIVDVPSTSGPNPDGIVGFRLNSDTGANYSNTEIDGTGSSAVSTRNSSLTRYNAFYQDAKAQRFIGSIQFMSYANTNVNKTILASFANASSRVRRSVGLYRSTSAITAIQFYMEVGMSFDSGTICSLFGIKASA